jgi:aryl-alcohol dehydrogenase-like predicted oxidoreductase
MAPSDESIEEPFTVLAELKHQGLIRHLGLSNVSPRQLHAAVEGAHREGSRLRTRTRRSVRRRPREIHASQQLVGSHFGSNVGQAGSLRRVGNPPLDQ